MTFDHHTFQFGFLFLFSSLQFFSFCMRQDQCRCDRFACNTYMFVRVCACLCIPSVGERKSVYAYHRHNKQKLLTIQMDGWQANDRIRSDHHQPFINQYAKIIIFQLLCSNCFTVLFFCSLFLFLFSFVRSFGCCYNLQLNHVAFQVHLLTVTLNFQTIQWKMAQ